MRILATLICLSSLASAGLQTDRWKAAKVRPERVHEAQRIANRILASKARYDAAAAKSGVPWHVIAGLHNMESGGSFRHHLHEGSPLTGRTRWIPKGRPFTGSPPFTWEESAIDALRYDRMNLVDWCSLESTLYACERYNGTGYLRYHPETPTPYLWAGTTLERPGRYVSDGVWSPTARSKQTGIAAIWKVLRPRLPK